MAASSASASSASPASASVVQGPRGQPEPRRRLPGRQRLRDLRGRLARDHGDGRRRPHRGRGHLDRGREADLAPPRARARPTSPSSSSSTATSTPPCRTCRPGWPRPARRLPREIDPPIITKTNPEDQPILWLSLSGNRARRPSWPTTCATCCGPQFQTIEGVGEVFIGGYRERNIRVWFDAAAPGGAGPHRAGRDRRHRARAPRGAGRPHRDRRARDERARRGRGRSTSQAFREPGGRLPPGHAGAAQGRGGGGGRARGPPPHRPRQGRARRSASASASCAAPTRSRWASASRPSSSELRAAPARGPVDSSVQLRQHHLHRALDRRDPLHAGAGRAAHRPRVLAVPRARGPRRSTCCWPSPPRSSARSS